MKSCSLASFLQMPICILFLIFFCNKMSQILSSSVKSVCLQHANFSKRNYKNYHIWLALRVGKMNQTFHCDWLSLDYPQCPARKIVPESHIIIILTLLTIQHD